MGKRRVAVLATVVLGGYATAPPPRAPAAPPAPVVAQPEPPPTFRCGPRDREWERWSGDLFGRGLEVLDSGPDPARLQALAGEDRARAEVMLRRGIAACEILAVQAIDRADWRNLMPDLTRAVAAERSDFRVRVILTLRRFGSSDDFTKELITALGSGSERARMTAAIGAREFTLAQMRAPLLDRVRRDPSWFVRQHAAESLIDLADIYPRDLHEHPTIAAGLVDTHSATPNLFDLLGRPAPPPSADELARLAAAADCLDREITERLAAGTCSKSAPLHGIDLHIIRINDHAVALALEDSVASCERTLTFVAFLESRDGFDRWLSNGISSRDPLDATIETPTTKLPIGYVRATRHLTIGGLVVDTTKANVVVLSTSSNGVAERYRAVQNLTFPRHGRPPSVAIDLLRFRPEITEAVRAVLSRTPEIGALLR